MKVEEKSEKAGLKLRIQKTNIMASSPITSWQRDEEKWKQQETLFSWAPKSLQTVTAAMKLKDVAVSIFSSSLCHEVMSLGAMILVF